MVEKRVRGIGAVIASMVVACLVVVAPFELAMAGSRAGGAFPCVDVDGDGECTAGVDTDISSQLELGSASTTGHVVIPADVLASSKGMMAVYANGNITVRGKVRGDWVTLWAGGMVTVGGNATVNGKDGLDIYANGDIVVETGAMLKTGGLLYLLSWTGGVSAGDVTLEGRDGVDVNAYGGGVVFGPGSKLQSAGGETRIYATGDVTVNGASLRGASAMIFTEGHLIDFQGGSLSLTSRDGSAFLVTQGSTVNIKGTSLRNIGPDQLVIDAETVIR